MVCSSRDLGVSGVGAAGDGANTSSLGYVRLEAECSGVEDDFYAATPCAIAHFAALVGWPSFFVVDSLAAALPLMMFAALSGVLRLFAALSGVLRGHVACAAMVCAAIFWDGCRGVARARPGDRRLLGSFGRPSGPDCLQPYPGWLRWSAAIGMAATGWAATKRCSLGAISRLFGARVSGGNWGCQ